MGKIKVVWGAPCSGKSTYAREHMQDGDVVYDYDALIGALTGRTVHATEKTVAHRLALTIRNDFIRHSDDAGIGTAWLLTRRPSDYLKCKLKNYLDVEYIQMETSREECLARLDLDETRTDKEAWAEIINNWFDTNPNMEAENVGRKHEIYITEEIAPDSEAFNYETYQWETVESPTSQNHFVKLLADVQSADEVHLYINCLGGSVKEALGIFQQLQRCPATVYAHIDGFAASAASVIAMGADEVIMPRNTCMMIHNAAWWAYGNPAQLRKSADDLDVINASAIESYMMHAGEKMSAETLQRFLDAETWLTAEECLEFGLADTVADLRADAKQPMQMYAAAAKKCVKYPAAKLTADMAAKLGAKSAPESRKPQPAKADKTSGLALLLKSLILED